MDTVAMFTSSAHSTNCPVSKKVLQPKHTNLELSVLMLIPTQEPNSLFII